jgi:hypothetical protein
MYWDGTEQDTVTGVRASRSFKHVRCVLSLSWLRAAVSSGASAHSCLATRRHTQEDGNRKCTTGKPQNEGPLCRRFLRSIKKKTNYFCGDVSTPPDPIPETTKFCTALLNKSWSRVSFLTVSSVTFALYLKAQMTFYRTVYTAWPIWANAAGQTRVSWISVQW